MGRALLRLLETDPALQLVAAVADREIADAVRDVPVLQREQLREAPDFDVAIDFSQPDGFDGILALCRSRGVALVSGTTGLSELQREAMRLAAADIPLLWASNFSLGVAVLGDLARRAARYLPGWDINIVETHHVHKKDAPSGTAITLADAVAEGCGLRPEIHSLRDGEVVGEHLVRLVGVSELLELRHDASNRDVFARGALVAAVALNGQPAGYHDFAGLLLR